MSSKRCNDLVDQCAMRFVAGFQHHVRQRINGLALGGKPFQSGADVGAIQQGPSPSPFNNGGFPYFAPFEPQRPPPQVDYSHAPRPEKTDNIPERYVLVLGDSMARVALGATASSSSWRIMTKRSLSIS